MARPFWYDRGMVRTRDFVLFLLIVLFLAAAIGVTQLTVWWQQVPVFGAWLTSNPDTEVEYTATVPTSPDTRAERLRYLRALLADRDLALGAPAPVVTEVAPSATTSVPLPPAEAVVLTCSGYAPLQLPWSPQSIVQENREGMRVYYERGLPTDLSTEAAPELVRARLPLRTWPMATPSCLAHDVVGIALDGSLIRNNEQALYAVFGSETLIGYAIDGFPIYGAAPVAVDTCGGALVDGQYRYLIDAGRPGLLNCFAGIPSTLQ